MNAENGDTVVFAHPAPVNGDRPLVNGTTNGHSSSSSSKHRSSSGSSHKSSSKDKHRSSSSSSKSHHSSSGSSSKDKPSSSSSGSRDKDKSSSSSSAHKSSSSSSRDKDKDRHRDKPHGSSSSSSNRDKERKDKEPHKSSSSSTTSGSKEHKSNNGSSSTSISSTSNKEHKPSGSGSSSNRDKDKHRSSVSSSSHGKDKDRQHKHSSSSTSSSSKHKHSSSSSSSKHRSDKDRHNHSSSTSKSGSKDHKSGSSSSISHKPSVESTNNHVAAQQPSNIEMAIAVPANNGAVYVADEQDPLSLNVSSVTDNSFAHQLPPVAEIKQETHSNNHIDTSQASSCDYSMSQFKADESGFVVKADGNNLYDDDDEDEGNSNGPNSSTYDAAAQSVHNRSVKHELNADDDEDDEEDAPIAKRFKVKSEPADDSDEDAPILAKRIKTEKVKKAKKKKHQTDDEEDDDYSDAPIKKKVKKEKKVKVISTPTKPVPVKRESLNNSNTSPMKGGRKKKDEQPEEVWKWWEEEKRDDGVKWNFLEHRGPVFAPDYEPLPDNVQFQYDGRPMKLSQDAEEIACFYGKMINHDFTSKPVFNDNFFGDWRKAMTPKERERITKLKHCNFQQIFEHFQAISERNKSRSKEEKAALKAENEALMAEYGFCTIDGHKEKIGNFRIEPPGLFRGRGEHPKMGKIKRRVMPEDILINCARGSRVPEPPAGHRWREVKHDNSVTWLASWTENVQGQVKYVMLNPSSKLKGEKDWQKYETARRLHKHIDRIRNTYKEEWKSKEMRIRQRGVALYFIDKLALRAGNEKDEDQADTVGCCSLRVEHIQLHRQKDDRENVVVFDFLGKDSIRYYNEVEVEKRVFKNLELFRENKKDGDDLFDRLNTVVMNEHLRELMDGLTAKVFRTYNASWTLQCQLNEMTDENSSVPEKMLAYNRANRAVAVLCNHQRAVPKSHEKSMENLKEKIRTKREQVDDLQMDVKNAVKDAKHGSVKEKVVADKKKKQLQRAEEQLKKMELQETDRDENKTIALGTSKLNYLDPRISVAWCKKHDVPIDKIYNKTQRDKFRWAIDMATEDYQF